MIPVGLARTQSGYEGLEAPFHPGKDYPELRQLLGEAGASGAPNGVYAGVRASLYALGLDAERFGSEDWNPLRELVRSGGRIVLKPNFIRHWNPNPQGTLDSVITHGSVVRAIADYAFLAAGPQGAVLIAEAPQMDCDFEQIRALTGLESVVHFYDEALDLDLAVVDLRREQAVFEDGIVTTRHPLPGDPLGYRAVDLAQDSFFFDSGLDPERFRGADYDSEPTSEHHRGGRHEYLLSETVLSADLVVNLPKLKTHKKTGVTLAVKNLVGINGDKNWLPHHSLGSPTSGGDEYAQERWVDRLRSRALEHARGWLSAGRGLRFFRLARRLESATRGDDFIRSGNWWGNRTTWRMCLDLNRCFYYSNADGLFLDAKAPVRRALTLLDGVVAGEGEGPLAPTDRPLGVLIAGLDPLAVDLVAVRLMGFDEDRLPVVREALIDRGPRITAVRSPEDVAVKQVDAGSLDVHDLCLSDICASEPFLAHPGWRGQIERTRS